MHTDLTCFVFFGALLFLYVVLKIKDKYFNNKEIYNNPWNKSYNGMLFKRAYKITNNQNFISFIESLGLIDYINDYGESVKYFPNGYMPSIIDINDGKYSCAYYDIDGYFIEWSHPNPEFIGSNIDSYICSSEYEVYTFIKSVFELPSYL